MAKRFIDTEMFKKKFIRTLPSEIKLFWIYLLNECNHAGIWEVDFEVAEIKLGVKLNENWVKNFFKEKIKILKNGNKWFIPDFITFQYGELKENNRAHLNVISILKKENLIDENLKIKPLGSPLQAPSKGAKDMDMEKEMEKEKEKEKEKVEKEKVLIYPFNSISFKNAWQAWIDYKRAEFNFKYKSEQTEQIALKELSELSQNNETTAIKIIQQSIANTWKGFFPLKQNNTNGTRNLQEEYTQLGNAVDEWVARKYGK